MGPSRNSAATVSQKWLGSQPYLPLDFFLVGLLLPVVGLTAGTLGLIFLATTPPITLFQRAYHHITYRICSRLPQASVTLRLYFPVGNEH